jgi:hypothetical protein
LLLSDNTNNRFVIETDEHQGQFGIKSQNNSHAEQQNAHADSSGVTNAY